ncbi:bifunctional methylenetetrahydrofolate dehydrogenase/methenyltetrahydrofolate cyclohydrolase FolD [Enterococcus nangangensis]
MTTLLDGRALANRLQQTLQAEIATAAFVPTLVVILVGDNPASQVYVRNKKKAAEKAGMRSIVEVLPTTVSQADLLTTIKKYNDDETVDGILVQLPLPPQIDEEAVLLAIDPAKDVDGFHPLNIGRLYSGRPTMIPATPKGIMTMLQAYDIPLAGKTAVVVGRSNIVGKPIAQLLLQADATVTIAHSKTPDLKAVTVQADILVVAIGRSKFITPEYVKAGACVIDVGMNRDENGKLCGDVDFAAVYEKTSAITPVPKGVGPMTITSLLQQTFKAAQLRRGCALD